MGPWKLHLQSKSKKTKAQTKLLIKPGINTSDGTIEAAKASLNLGPGTALVLEGGDGIVLPMEVVLHSVQQYESGQSDALDDIPGVDLDAKTIQLQIQVKRLDLGTQVGVSMSPYSSGHGCRTRARSKHSKDTMRKGLRANLAKFAPRQMARAAEPVDAKKLLNAAYLMDPDACTGGDGR
jgi:hypothetical protein